jgi:hypothetical protein
MYNIFVERAVPQTEAVLNHSTNRFILVATVATTAGTTATTTTATTTTTPVTHTTLYLCASHGSLFLLPRSFSPTLFRAKLVLMLLLRRLLLESVADERAL